MRRCICTSASPIAVCTFAAMQQNPNVLLNHPTYEFIHEIGQGSFGFVQLCRHKQTGEQVAIKFMEHGQEVDQSAEVFNHHSVKLHPHIVQFKDVFYVKGHLAIVMEYVSGGTLAQFVAKQPGGRVAEPLARWIFQQLIIALDYCHKKGIVNRDIKLDNTLVQNMPDLPGPLVKICDFGYSKAVYLSKPKSMVGTAAYVSPEVLHARGGKREYDATLSDVWSAGVMLYAMLYGKFPFEDPSLPANAPQQVRQNRMVTRIAKGQWAFPEAAADLTDVSASCRHLISRILVCEPTARANIQEVIAHDWFQTDLPPGALDINENVAAASSAESDVTHIVQALLDAANPEAGLMDAEFDSYDDLIQEGDRLSMGSKITYSIEPNQKFEFPMN